MKSNSDVRPPIIQDLGNGSYYYNYNIHEVQAPTQEGEENTKKVFEYDTVLIWGTPNYDKCVKAVLRDRRDETEEFNLINKYNSFILGISSNPNDKASYEAYLSEVATIKDMVDIDLRTAGY